MELASTVDFANAARRLARAATRRGLDAPSFRCPPKLVGVDRTIRRRPPDSSGRRRSGGTVVSVRVRGRPYEAVLADMIEGVVATNALKSPEADRLRNELWSLVTSIESPRTDEGASTRPVA